MLLRVVRAGLAGHVDELDVEVVGLGVQHRGEGGQGGAVQLHLRAGPRHPYGPTRLGERRVLLGDTAQQAADALRRDIKLALPALDHVQ